MNIKFMLNRLNKRYRSCIDCVMRQRKYRQNRDNDNADNNDIHDHGVLAILDIQEDEAYPIEQSMKEIDYPQNEPNQEPDFPIEPHTDISTYSHIEFARVANDPPDRRSSAPSSLINKPKQK